MKTLRHIFTITILLAATVIYAQEASKPIIEVTGTAEIAIVPDEIYISIDIWEKYENKAKVTIEEQEATLREAIKSIEVDPANLVLTNMYAKYTKINWHKKDVLAKKEYSLKVSNATEVGKTFKELEKLELTSAYIDRFAHSKMDSLRKEVRIMAIKAAKLKSDYLLAALGKSTGMPELIREIPETTREEFNSFRGNSYYNVRTYKDSDTETGVEFEKIKIKASVFVMFAIG